MHVLRRYRIGLVLLGLLVVVGVLVVYRLKGSVTIASGSALIVAIHALDALRLAENKRPPERRSLYWCPE